MASHRVSKAAWEENGFLPAVPMRTERHQAAAVSAALFGFALFPNEGDRRSRPLRSGATGIYSFTAPVIDDT
jgi:hypothetical protein